MHRILKCIKYSTLTFYRKKKHPQKHTVLHRIHNIIFNNKSIINIIHAVVYSGSHATVSQCITIIQIQVKNITSNIKIGK